MEKEQEFDVGGELWIAFFTKIKAKTEDEAKEIAKIKLDRMYIELEEMKLRLVNGEIVKLDVMDDDVKISEDDI